MLVLGPIIFGFIFGLVLGSQIKNNPKSDAKFTVTSYIVIVIAGIVVSWQLGQYPFYNDVPISTAFLTTLIGILLGKVLFTRGSSN